MKMIRYYTIFFVTLTAIEIWAESAEEISVIYLTKPLIVFSLLVLTFIAKSRIPKKETVLLRTALFFAICGDIFLMIRGSDLFIPGLGSFLVMQWLYIALFRKQTTDKIGIHSLLSFVPFAVLAAALVLLIFDGLPDVVLKVAVIVYAASIAIMAWTAFLRKQSVSSFSFYSVFLGAMLFMISDSLIAIGKFLTAIPHNGIWVMSTYAAAQFLIVTGLIQKSQTD